MELRDFVAETLRQIIDGIKAAQEYSSDKGAKVNPKKLYFRTDQGSVKLQDRSTGALVQEIDFDVAVTTTEGTQTKGGIGVFVGPIGLGSQGQSNVNNQSVSRIKFSVPLLLPLME